MKLDIKKQRKKVTELLRALPYDQDKNIVGDIGGTNVYVQFVPQLKGFHRRNTNGNICVFYLDINYDARKKLICPTCKEDLSKELCGIKKLEAKE